MRFWIFLVAALLVVPACSVHSAQPSAKGPGAAAVTGWLHWRGPNQDGTSAETGPPRSWRPGGENHLWSLDLAGRGTPVIARGGAHGDRVYAWGYRGEKTDLVEVLACLDARTGATIWEHAFADFISDIIYDRYSIGSPTIDPQTGNVYLMTSPGLLVGFDRDGKLLWQRSMMEELGRLTFPNGRTGAPSIEGDLVIVNTISTNWGREGPARNRFYAFDKSNGQLVWSSTPGVGPPFLKDSSFCSPVFAWSGSGRRRVFYAGTGCGNVVCVDARTGSPLWRYQMAMGGLNSSIVRYDDTVIAIHGKENTDDTGRGRMVAIRAPADPKPDGRDPVVLDKSHEAWRNNELSMFTSSPVIVGDRVYQVTVKGDLVCVDARTGKTLWHKKLGADQLHASPLYAGGNLYVPMWHDGLYIIKPTEQGALVLDQVQLEGSCLGSPSVWNGQIYVHTTEKLYCFGKPWGAVASAPSTSRPAPPDGAAASKVQVVPAEVLMRPGDVVGFKLRGIDDAGNDLGPTQGAQWRKFVPPTAKVISYLDAGINEHGQLAAAPNAQLSAGAFELTAADGTKGYVRGRILPSPPYAEDFESFQLNAKRPDGTAFAYPPLPWIGARLKWEVRSRDGNKVLVKTLDRWLFQRSMAFVGHAGDSDYTLSADVKSDGNRRGMSDVGLVNQRYIIVLRGNGQELEVNSNIERLAEKVPFAWDPKTWYRLKTRVDVAPDGSGTVRGKAWPKGSEEPAPWTIEVPVPRAHTNGSPGLYGFSPNIRFAVYLDNLSVTPN